MKILSSRMTCLGASLLLAACAGPQTFKEGEALLDQGQLAQGLARMEQAAREQPSNAAYRIGYLSRRAAIINTLNTRSDQLRQEGKYDEAAQLTAQVLAIDPANSSAQLAITALERERRHAAMVSKAASASDSAQAREMLRVVLQEQPTHRGALALQNRLAAEQAKAGADSGKLSAAYRKPVTLEFRDTPLRSVFDFLGKVAGLNFVFDRDVDPGLRATISVRGTSIEEAIGMLLSSNGLEQSVTGERSITIFPNTAQKLKDYQRLVVRSFYLANADVKTVSYSIKTLLKAKDIVTDDRLGIIMMRDTPDMIRMAEKVIAMQDIADPEVMLEVEVLEVKRTRLMELGVRWPDQAVLNLTNAAGALTPLNLADLGGINRGRIALGIGGVQINANKTDTDSNILANPRIRVRNKEKAKVLIGERVPVITVTTNNGVSSDSVNYVDVGLKLDVEPNIYLDDEVAIKVNLEVSNVVREVISKSGTQAYQIGTRSAATVLRLKDGETQVLAGLISDEDRRTANKLPGVGQLPILNRLFGSQKDDSTRSEIVLSITPRVLRSVRRPDLMTAQFDSGTDANVAGGMQQAALPAEAPPAPPSPMTGTPEPEPQLESKSEKPPGAPAPLKVIQ